MCVHVYRLEVPSCFYQKINLASASISDAVCFTFLQTAEISSKIYLINCLSAVQQPLTGQEVAANYVSNLCSVIETHTNVLVEKEVDAILRHCGLSSKISYIQNLTNEGRDDEHGPLAEVEEMSPQVLSECLRTFFGLVMGNEGSLPEFEQLQVPKLHSDACARVARALSGAYELLYGVITDPRNRYPDPKSLVRHSPDQIRTILEI